MTTTPTGGKVYLVGAGPGSPDLLTLRARRVIEEADVVMYDSLVSDAVLGIVPETATGIDVGKRPGPDGERTTQAEIHREMVARTRRGRTVARLKGGDPGVFGRGGEEAEHLAEAGVPFEIVPGVTSAVAAPGVAGIPITHRDHASAVTVITGHEDPTKAESALEWQALAETIRSGGTLLILMGVGRLPENLDALRDHGVDPETPVALIEKATLDGETTVTGTVETIVDIRDEVGIEPPALTVVGDVVGVRERVRGCLDRDATGQQAALGEAGPPVDAAGTVLTAASHAGGPSRNRANNHDD